MIISASRRTDIPARFSPWLFNRLKEGYALVQNPMNPRQISRVDLSPEAVDGLVLWTKNPLPMLSDLCRLEPYPYYFQFTLTPYGRDVEPGLPEKPRLLEGFIRLSEEIGRHRVIWRYDPILLAPGYDWEFHLRAFEEMARLLEGYAQRVVISFVDLYAKTRRSTAGLELSPPPGDGALLDFAGRLADIAGRHGFTPESCAEKIDLLPVGIRHGSCIDKALIEDLIGCRLTASKDKNQRPECGCFESVDIGAYNTCRNGCRYCYATFNQELVERQTACFDRDAPLLCGAVGPEDVVKDREVRSLRDGQISLF